MTLPCLGLGDDGRSHGNQEKEGLLEPPGGPEGKPCSVCKTSVRYPCFMMLSWAVAVWWGGVVVSSDLKSWP